MRLEFIKMHGLGNDFLVLDARERALPELTADTIRRLADRHTGIGFDQLVRVTRAETGSGADIAMTINNADGSVSGACGNAARAVARLHGAAAVCETAGGLIRLDPVEGGARVDMGRPRLAWDEIPLAYAMDTAALPLAWDQLARPAAVNVGNPHAVFFVPDCDAVALGDLGPRIEHDPVFPERINVNVATVENRGRIRLRVWERGAGLTRACGTGACATAVAAMCRGLIEREVEVALPGGTLVIAWPDGGTIAMSGPASEAYRGSFDLGDFA